jgi:hypothetical protein
VYTVTLHDDGTATWNGERFTAPLGEAAASIDSEDFFELAAFIERVGFFDWAESYSGDVTCVAGFSISTVAGGTTKTVSQTGTREPTDFWVIARLIDACAREVGWGVGAHEDGAVEP